MAEKEFLFKVPQDIYFGKGCLKKIPEILAQEKAEKVFLISDAGLKSVGVVDKVEKIVTDAGYKVEDYLGVVPNPTMAVVNEATQQYKASGCKCIIALGGGGPMDVAKSVGLLATYGGDDLDYVGYNKVPGPIVPLIAIPTTAGTGSEVTASSVIVNEKTHYKMAVIDYNLIPKYALADPEMIMTLPAKVAAACGIDAFVHAEEAYVSKKSNPITDAFAEKAMELIGANIRRFVASRDDEEAACNMMLGSTLAGISFMWALLGDVHAMSHPVSGYFNVPHGVANAVLLPTIVEYNALADNGRYKKIYNYITNGKKADDSFTPDMLAKEIRKLNADLGIPANLTEAGVTEDKIPLMAIDAMKSGNILVNPRQTTIKDVEALYHKAM